MRYFYFALLIISFLGCKNLMLNAAFESMGVYEDTVNISKMASTNQEIVFIPMQHIGTPLFYNDVKKKVDSLSSKNFFFYTEMLKGDFTNDSSLRKFRKITGNPIPGKGYIKILDSVWGKNSNIKLKKNLIDQPSYLNLGVDIKNNKNVDATLEEVILYYENKYGEIKLQACDFETQLFEETACKDQKLKREIKNDFILNSRNEIILKELDNETRHKIAIIYGKGHLPGLIKGLEDRGFTKQ